MTRYKIYTAEEARHRALIKQYNNRKIKFIKTAIISLPYNDRMKISEEDYNFLVANIDDYNLIITSKVWSKIPYGYGLEQRETHPTKLDGELTLEWLHENFLYEPETGLFIYRRHRSAHKVGQPVTSLQTAGYPYITVNKKNYLVHRVAWFMTYGEWPKKWLDHINGVRDDNRICNLRESTHQENLRYRPAPKNNTSGYKNIQLIQRSHGISYKILIYKEMDCTKKECLFTKQVKTLEEALEIRDAKLIEWFGEFAYLDYPVGHPKHQPYAINNISKE